MKLDYKRTLLIGLCFMSISAFWTFYDQVIPYMLEFSFGDVWHRLFGDRIAGMDTATFATNIVMTFDNVLAVFMLPLFGTLSDRTHTRFGKRTPYIALGTLFSVSLYVGLGFAEKARCFPAFFAVLLLLLISLATYRSPAVALMPDLTPRAHRSKGNAIINLMGTFGGAYSLLMVLLLVKTEKDAQGAAHPDSETNYLPAILLIAAFMLVSVVVFLLTVREKKLADLMSAEAGDEEEAAEETLGKPGEKLPTAVRRSLVFMLLSVALWYMAYNGCTTALSRYCLEILGADLSASSGFVLVALIVATAAFLPIGILSSRFGRKKMILAGVALMTVSFGAAFFVREINFVLYLLFALVGIGWSAINVNSFPMVVEMSRDADIGKYTGYYYTFSMAAQVLTPILSAFLLANENIGYLALFPYAAVCSALAFVTMLFVRHGDVKPTAKKSLLENFDADD